MPNAETLRGGREDEQARQSVVFLSIMSFNGNSRVLEGIVGRNYLEQQFQI